MARILVVDDEPNIREVVGLYLRRDGHAVVEAADGKEALELYRRTRPDLVVLDLMLPKMSGLEVCRRLGADRRVPLIMLTARGEEEDRIVGLSLGADDYVTKPFSPRELAARVAAVLRRVEEPTSAGTNEKPLDFDGLAIDPSKREVLRGRGPDAKRTTPAPGSGSPSPAASSKPTAATSAPKAWPVRAPASSLRCSGLDGGPGRKVRPRSFSGEPEIQGVRYGPAAPDLFRIS